MKIAVLNDTHAGVRNSSDIFLNYQKKFYSEVFFPYCQEHGITQILHLGDYYDHRKFINFKTQNENRKMFLEPMKELGITMDIIPGNHDVFYKNTNNLCSLKELLGYYTSNVNIMMKPTTIDYEGLRIACIPWINNENYDETMKYLSNCNADWVGSHLELQGFEMMRGVTNTHGMTRETFKRFELVMSGHFHTKSSQDNIHYLGSQFEFTWADAGDPKYFHVIDTEKRELIPIKNNNTIFKKVFYNDEKVCYNSYNCNELIDKFVKVVVVSKTNHFMFDTFIDRIQNIDHHELKIAETFDEFIGENVMDESISVEDTTELLDSYVEAVDTDLDKERMKGLMRSLYVEAQNSEVL
jgi:DNA repair exonuclease SbcCD nuclease subunit